MKAIALPEIILIALVSAVIVWPFWRIFRRIGLPGPLALLMLVPGLNLVITFVVAFIRWPIEEKLRQFESSAQSRSA